MGRKGLGIAVAVLMLVTACGQQPDSQQRPQHYVALGDSYTSAPGTGESVGSPPGCDRSRNNYPRLVAAELSAERFTDASCSGATTRDITRPQQTPDGTNPPQLNAVRPETTLVTIGIGGNDVGLVALAGECAANQGTRSCQRRLAEGGIDELAARIESAGEAVGQVLARINAKAPDARVVVVGYPTILPADPAVCPPELPYADEDIAYLRRGLQRLNTVLAEQARQHGAEFADTAKASVGHGMCAPPDSRWVEGPRSTTGAAPLHPNARGERSMASAVVRELS
ncbi:lysophospholipase L1-like esterase [Saccharomonospora amisosensis]|uniref:Lysophospholipase L1-like esterase n=1 Tax=Saccharomonospora amisosensis TaxID=1128677 RepID=A0A7X5UU96_9PSEU|nr:SGNH/GDSL hydrolase family protein [Saccharomonospora amisosensis]NIJ14255.1 lysophospholipase L1-like esterase [Saccharomonospora amisosensis]